jgi:bifunctional DNA-binding transcriptional regulator/antitoxin component of YhaV-PrlF toxin-antitoxin module
MEPVGEQHVEQNHGDAEKIEPQVGAGASRPDEVQAIPFEVSRIIAPAHQSILPFPPDMAEERMEVAKAPIMFEKTLTQSDTSGGGRIVIPKAVAEKQFPTINDPQGCLVAVVDVFGETHALRFRYWVNNNSRMYILEGVGPLLKLFKLGVGDVLIFGKDESENLVICGRKGTKNDNVRKTGVNKKKRRQVFNVEDPMIQHTMMGGLMSPAVKSRTLSNDEAELQCAFNYWNKLSFPPRPDGVFRAVPMSRLREPDAVTVQYGMFCSTVTIAGEQYQAFFDTREAAQSALTVSIQSIL